MRKPPNVRQAEIVEAGLKLALEHGYAHVSRDAIGDAIGVSGQAVVYHFGDIACLRRCIMRAAVRGEVLPVIAQGLVASDPLAQAASPELQRRALDFVLTND